MRWRRAEGLPFDPWMRVHAATWSVDPACRAAGSMKIVHPVTVWERWVQMQFPDDGEYVFPGGLTPLSVSADTGSYWEPNVWMLHEL